MRPRWYAVGRWHYPAGGPLDGALIPASVGRRGHATRIGARLHAARENRAERRRIGPQHLPPVHWHAERPPHPDQRPGA